MSKYLSIKQSFNSVFDTYSERYKEDYIFFEGHIKDKYFKIRDDQIIRFINGGRKYLSYELKRDRNYIKGWIKYHPYKSTKNKSTQRKPKISKSKILKIKELEKEELSQKNIADLVGVSQTTVGRIINNKGNYKNI